MEKTRQTLEQQTGEVRTAIEEKLKTASAQRDENIKKMLERLREHVSGGFFRAPLALFYLFYACTFVSHARIGRAGAARSDQHRHKNPAVGGRRARKIRAGPVATRADRAGAEGEIEESRKFFLFAHAACRLALLKLACVFVLFGAEHETGGDQADRGIHSGDS